MPRASACKSVARTCAARAGEAVRGCRSSRHRVTSSASREPPSARTSARSCTTACRSVGNQETFASSASRLMEASDCATPRMICGARVMCHQVWARCAHCRPMSSAFQSSKRGVGRHLSSTSPSRASSPAQKDNSAHNAADSSSVSRRRAVLTRSRCAMPPLRKTAGADCDNTSRRSVTAPTAASACWPAPRSTKSRSRVTAGCGCAGGQAGDRMTAGLPTAIVRSASPTSRGNATVPGPRDTRRSRARSHSSGVLADSCDTGRSARLT